MFAHVALELPMGEQTVIPDTAVLRTGTHNVAFIDRDDGYLTPAEIELGPHVGDEFIVLKGLSRRSANRQLRQFPDRLGKPTPGGRGSVRAASAGRRRECRRTNGRSPQASIEFTTDPSPLVRGHNKMIVTLRDSKGEPISGAQVTVSFEMAAMPAMGMAAMRARDTAVDQGNGTYAANIELPSGGTWSLTINASKGGQPIATKQVDVSASGSMAM